MPGAASKRVAADIAVFLNDFIGEIPHFQSYLSYVYGNRRKRFILAGKRIRACLSL